jgi:hypothetical protein
MGTIDAKKFMSEYRYRLAEKVRVASKLEFIDFELRDLEVLEELKPVDNPMKVDLINRCQEVVKILINLRTITDGKFDNSEDNTETNNKEGDEK